MSVHEPLEAPLKNELAMHEAANSPFFKPFWIRAGAHCHTRRLELGVPRDRFCEDLKEHQSIDGFDAHSLEAFERFGYDVGTYLLFAICEALSLEPVDVAKGGCF
ncbi:hypothetical protein [uncultured Mediterranean phage uvMED]|nr:hypothetical protein [uncultured Mediterranean phage uvMED]